MDSNDLLPNTVQLSSNRGKLGMVSTKGEQVSVHLKEFSLVSSKIPSREIFKAIEIAIPASAIEQAITKTKVGSPEFMV